MIVNKTCVLSTVESDSHMWNLVYMQLFLEEHGYQVTNLGCCVKPQKTIKAILSLQPDLVVISSVNGHGYVQGLELLAQAQAQLHPLQAEFVIGGKLSTQEQDNPLITEKLLKAGYSGVFVGQHTSERFSDFLTQRQPPHSASRPLQATC